MEEALATKIEGLSKAIDEAIECTNNLANQDDSRIVELKQKLQANIKKAKVDLNEATETLNTEANQALKDDLTNQMNEMKDKLDKENVELTEMLNQQKLVFIVTLSVLGGLTLLLIVAIGVVLLLLKKKVNKAKEFY